MSLHSLIESSIANRIGEKQYIRLHKTCQAELVFMFSETNLFQIYMSNIINQFKLYVAFN